WPFDKFVLADRSVTTQMKATGEVMAIARTFEAALLKAVRGTETGVHGLRLKGIAQWGEMELEEVLRNPSDERIYAVAEALRRGWDVDEVVNMTAIDPWFVVKMQGIVKLEEELRHAGERARTGADGERVLPPELLRACKKRGFSDRDIAELTQFTEAEIREQRKSAGLTPAYKMVDTCAAEFEAQTPYFYSSYEPSVFDEAAGFAEREQA
ncbi:MAG TPA: carbamoyl-phosphate synthase large subunit, partial [Armatimonadota bacterium]|nr:carbamoyl-phosphate synthase large subunit [Armatimonadota bacterium]